MFALDKQWDPQINMILLVVMLDTRTELSLQCSSREHD